MSTGQGVLGCNMFCYCLNNPVNMADESGCVANYNTMMTDGGSGTSHKVIYNSHKAETSKEYGYLVSQYLNYNANPSIDRVTICETNELYDARLSNVESKVAKLCINTYIGFKVSKCKGAVIGFLVAAAEIGIDAIRIPDGIYDVYIVTIYGSFNSDGIREIITRKTIVIPDGNYYRTHETETRYAYSGIDH